MNVKPLCVIAAAAGLLPGLNGIAAGQEDIKVTPIRIYESRSRNLEPGVKTSKYNSSVRITLRLSGESVKKATRVGKATFKAVDDKGNELESRSSYRLTGKRLYRIRHSGPDYKGKIPPRDRYDVSLSFAPPARGAKAIAEVTGTTTVRIAETSNIDIPLASLKGKKRKDTIDDEAFKKAGVSVEINSLSVGPNNFNGNFKVTGDKANSVLYCIVVDGDGKEIRNYGTTYWFSFGTRAYLSTSVSASKVPADAKLRFIVEQKYTDVEVSLDQKGIPLP